MFASDAFPRHVRISNDRDAAELFLWQGAGIVLMGDVEADRWIVVRGWVGLDTLSDVRRWSFASPTTLCGQIRRLTLDATGSHRESVAAAAAALAWTATATALRG